jgi:hypothetical protein
LARGADVNAVSTKMLPQLNFFNGDGATPPHLGSTPFMIAAHSADAELMQLLIRNGADPFLRAVDGQTALMAACEGIVENTTLVTEEKRLEALRVALDAGLDLEAEDAKGYRAMHVATRAGYHEVIKYLVANGADLNPVSKPQIGEGLGRYYLEGQSPLGLAEGTVKSVFYRRAETAAFLRTLGAKSIGRFDPNDYADISPEKTDQKFDAAKKK